MTGKRRRGFIRKKPLRDYRKLFIIATEGAETEPAYFAMFQSQSATVRVKLLDSRHKSSPKQVFARAREYIIKQGLRKGDSVWLVLDRDNWTVKQLHAVFLWCQESLFHLAVSNPCFELWLLFHFQNGSSVTSARNCREKLLRELPNFEKGHVEIKKLEPLVPIAIKHAEQKDNPPCFDWPRSIGSTVYRLVKELQ
ncbi:MAG: abortive phage resistance protein [Deltaproteobacteria bacterium]|nr:MAG: abortive phage resistance protein [Deltaproteobacteria bacterium]